MKIRIGAVIFLVLAAASSTVFAQQIRGTLVSVHGNGAVHAANDQVDVQFNVEELDKDRAAAASRVNQKIRHGTEMLKKLDPTARLTTARYYTYPVYDEPSNPAKRPAIVSWRVGQYVYFHTKDLQQLPAVVAEAEQTLSVGSVQFSLSEELTKTLESQRIAAAYANLQERIQIIASAMGKNPADAIVESLDVDGGYQPIQHVMVTGSSVRKQVPVEEPSFEPGESTLDATVSAKIRFN